MHFSIYVRLLDLLWEHLDDEDRFRQLMLSSGDMANDVGSVLYGEEAVTMGIIDRVGSLSDALDRLYRQMDRRREE